MDAGPYVQRHGDVYRIEVIGRSRQEQRICGPSDTLAAAFFGEDEPVCGHGTAEAVEAKGARQREAALAMGLSPVVVRIPVHPRTLEVLNQCIQKNWPARIFIERLAKLGEQGPSIRMPAAYPD